MSDAPQRGATPSAPTPNLVRVLHLSDIHCGRPFVAAHVAAAERLATASSWNAIVISGDFSQRAREREFEQAREILLRFRTLAPVLVVPGNHDTAWWKAPFGIGKRQRLNERYRRFISDDLEPTLRVPHLSIVGLNSSAGMLMHAVTWYPRDWRVKGGLTDQQLAGMDQRLAQSSPRDLRVLVLHHNVVRGRLSNRWGLKRPRRALDAIAAARPHVVCTGHDHEERIEVVTRAAGQFLVSAANTLSSRMRGHRPSALNVIEATDTQVSATAWVYDGSEFVPGGMTATMPREN
jgi:3',5'-cyclic AMP phosphodiesterase CpdA